MQHGLRGSRLGALVIHGLLVTGSLAGTLVASQGTAAANDEADQLFVTAKLADLGDAFKIWEKAEGRFKLGDRPRDNLEQCETALSALDKRSAPASAMFELHNDTPTLKAGKYRWSAEGRAACKDLGTAVERENALKELRLSMDACTKAKDQRGGPKYADAFTYGKYAYDQAVKAGIPPTEIITATSGTGTLQDLFDSSCTAGQAKLTEAEEAHAAPYKKLLKNDKLKTALQDEGFITLPGGAKATPASLAANNVWFEDASPDKFCPNGAQIHTLHRYQFDAAQKLAKVTNHDFCGRPPASAFH